MNVIKKIVRFPKVVALAFWEVLKYVWSQRARLLVPFLLGEVTYWTPFIIVCILGVMWDNYIWIASFYGFYVGVLPAIPIQIMFTFGYYALMLKIGGHGVNGLKEEAKQLINRIKAIN